MAASLPWRRDEKPSKLSWLASDPGGTGPADHATSDDPRRYRVGTISTSNAIRAIINVLGVRPLFVLTALALAMGLGALIAFAFRSSGHISANDIYLGDLTPAIVS